MNNLWIDFKVALRTLRNSPMAALLAVVVLGLGIGANSAMFSLVNALVLRPLPVPEPDRLINILSHDTGNHDYDSISYPNFADLREGALTFEDITAHTISMVGIGDGETVRRAFVDVVAANYFRTFGVRPFLGRDFRSEEERPGSTSAVAIVGHRLWRRLGGDESVLGQELTINGRAFTIVGVAPKNFAGTSTLLAPELFVPLGMSEQLLNDFMDSGTRSLSDRASGRLFVLGRLGPDVEREAADADLMRLSAALAEEYPEVNRGVVYETHPLSRVSMSTSPSTDRGVGALSVLLLAMSLAVLLVAGLNLAADQGARNLARRREIAVRLALGGGRLRIVRQLVIEAVLLALGGALLGIAGALLAPRVISASIARLVPFEILLDGELDWRIVSATLGFSLVAALVVGLMPSIRASRPSLVSDLKEGADQGRARRYFGFLSRGDLPVVFELALSMVLLVSAGLFVKGALRSTEIDPGFDLDSSVLVEIDPSLVGYDESQGRAVVERLRERLTRIPEVETVAAAVTVPFGLVSLGQRVVDSAAAAPTGDERPGVSARFNIITGDYFETLGIPMLRGRTFREDETEQVLIIDRLLAERLWGTEDPLGRRTSFFESDRLQGDAEVVGVVGTVRESLFDRSDYPHVYMPTSLGYAANQHLHLGVSGDASSPELLRQVREAMSEVDSRLPVIKLSSLEEHLESGFEIWTLRTGGRLFGLFALVALVIAVAGVYGVRAYSVASRTREIGLRMALGATVQNTVSYILRDGLRAALLGTTVGLLAAAGVAQLLQSFLFEVDSADVTVFGFAFLLLVAVATAACLIPARRASRLDPLVALREE